MIESLAGAGTSALVGATVASILCTLAARYLVPKWLEDQEKFKAETIKKLGELTTQIQTLVTERAELLRVQALENRRLQERSDAADTAIKFDIVSRDATLREMWHAEADQFNRQLGKVDGKAEENARAITGVYGRLDDMEEKAEKRHEDQSATIHKLDKNVDRLTIVIEDLNRRMSRRRDDTPSDGTKIGRREE